MAPSSSSSEVQRTLMGPPWASSRTAFTYGLKTENLEALCFLRHFGDELNVINSRKLYLVHPCTPALVTTSRQNATTHSHVSPPMKQNFMKLIFRGPTRKLTKTVKKHNKEHMELKFRMTEASNGNSSSFSLQRTKKSGSQGSIFRRGRAGMTTPRVLSTPGPETAVAVVTPEWRHPPPPASALTGPPRTLQAETPVTLVHSN